MSLQSCGSVDADALCKRALTWHQSGVCRIVDGDFVGSATAFSIRVTYVTGGGFSELIVSSSAVTSCRTPHTGVLKSARTDEENKYQGVTNHLGGANVKRALVPSTYAIGGSKGTPGTRAPTPGSKFFHFHAVFDKKSAK